MRPNEAAQALASYGRYGDTMLLHVNPLEVAGIASLVPGGLTTNPVTGLPEAFFFLPFLASMFSAAAPAAAAATAGAAAAGATAAGGLAAGGALASGLGLASTLGAGALTPALTAGTGLLASAAPAAGTIAATAAPAVTGGLGSLLGAGAATPALAGVAPAVASAAPAALAPGAIGAGLSAGNAAASGGLGSLLSGGANTLLGGAGVDTIAAAPPVFAPGGGMPSPLATPGGQSYAMGAGPTVGPPPTPPSGGTVLSGPKTGMLPPGPPTTGPAGQVVLSGPKTGLSIAAGPDAATGPGGGMLGKMGDYFSKNPMMALAGLQALKGLIPAGGKKKEKSNYRKGKYQGGPPVAAPAGFQHGIEPEHNYFPGYSNLYANNGGLVGYAEGGLVDPQAQKPQDMSFPLNGVPGGGGISDLVPEEIPSSPFPTEQIGSEPEPGADPAAVDTSNDQELVMQMVEVIQGKHPNPEPVIKAFVQEFGEQALQDLAMRVKQTTAGKGGPAGPPPGPPMPSPGGPSPMDMVGPPPQMGPPQGGPQGFAYGGPVGDGLSDSVPAKLSVGEFVVPADAVSGLGNGSTDAGAQHLQGMVNNVRMARGGSVQQPAPIRGGIAAMMNGGLVQGYKKGGKVKAEPEEEIQYYMPLLEPDQRTRTEHIWDFANPPKVIQNSPYSQEWSDSIHELQKAKRYLLENNIQ